MIFGPRGLGITPDVGVMNRRNPRRRFDGARPLRQLIPADVCSNDVRFHDDVGRAADHQQVFDVVAADQHEPAAPVNGGGIDHGKARHAPATGVGSEAIAGESANQPGRNHDQGQHGHECEDKSYSLHALSPANPAFIKPPVDRSRYARGERSLKSEPPLNIPRQELPPRTLIAYESAEPKRLLG
jgi:hypothetical protein